MKADELKGKTADELAKLLVDLKKEQVNQRLQKATDQAAKGSDIRKVRRDVARVKTQQSMLRLNKDTPAKKPAPKKTAKAKKAKAA